MKLLIMFEAFQDIFFFYLKNKTACNASQMLKIWKI